MIPKRIFYVWGANEPKKRDVLACMQSWRQTCPDYEIIEINENSTQYFNFKKELKANKWFKAVYDRKMWAYVADYVRIKTLYENGGIYLDTDVTVIKPFDPFLNDPAFVGMQSNTAENKRSRVEPAILGAEKGNIFLKNILDFYSTDIWHEPIFTIPDIFDKFLTTLYQLTTFPKKKDQIPIRLKEIVIYPERYFIPFRYQETFSADCVEQDTYTIHWFGGTWIDPDTLYWLKNKHNSEFLKQSTIKTAPCKIYRIKLFRILPFLKITSQNQIISTRLFGCIPLCRQKKNKIYLFNCLPIFSIKEK